MKSDKEYFDHIIEEIDFILKHTKKIDKESFIKDPVIKRACIRSIEIIGEAVKNISTDIKNRYKKVEWKKIAGSRDRIIHAYFSIDYDIIWDIIRNKIPELKEHIDEIGKNENLLF